MRATRGNPIKNIKYLDAYLEEFRMRRVKLK